MDFINSILDTLNGYLYGYILIALLVFTGLFLSFRLKFVQIRFLPDAFRQIMEKNDNKDSISSFQAFMISTASRVGIGNIAGVATAIALGGPGAVFWMWFMAIVGAASAFTESTLAQVYKSRFGKSFRGGPAYYIEKGLGSRSFGVVFAFCLIACFAYGINALQANNIVSAFGHYTGDSFLVRAIIGGILTAATAYVILGGQDKIANICTVMVPVMSTLYFILGLIVFFRNITSLPAVFQMIFAGAFDFKAIFGGFTGSAVMMGIKRGLFSNEAGMGSAPNAAASAQVSHPVKQGLVQALSVFIDTLVICSVSAFTILLSGVDTHGSQAMPLMQSAMSSQFGQIGILFITIAVFFFAFSSIIGNYYYTESNMMFIKKKSSSMLMFRITVLSGVFLGSIAGYDLAWNLTDVLMGIMTVINVVAILLLNGTTVKVLSDYTGQKKAGKDPVFVAESVGLNNTDLWRNETDH